MNGSEDCGSAQGNNKGNEASLLDLFLLDGMTGEKGAFACGLANTGEVQPGASSSAGGVTSAAVEIERVELKGKELKLKLKNLSDEHLYVTELVVDWTAAPKAKALKEVKLNGDFAKLNDRDGFTSLPAEASFNKDDKRRKLDKGTAKDLVIKFDRDVKRDYSTSDFSVIVRFDDGSEVVLGR
jgi:serine-aspartate repeat-containing protein C/D/E